MSVSDSKRVLVAAGIAALVVGFAPGSAGAQDPAPEPLPPGVPAWNWQQVITSPATVWVCRQRVERKGKSLWRVHLVAKSKETQWQVGASSRLQRWPRKKNLDDWSSGILEPGQASKVGHVDGDVDRNDRLTIGAGHKNGPHKGMGLGDTTTIGELNRC